MGYEDLLKEAENLNVLIKEKKLKLRDGLCYGNRIAINSDLKTLKEKNATLAEELGHFETSSGNILDQSNVSNRKQEKRARNWAYEKLAGIISIISAFEKGIRNKYELAEYLNVTEEFLEQAIHHYREKYGIYYEIDTYIIYFEPNFSIIKKWF
ncbi:ImmA/IrrE family metallo-endopeptidase [Clostridium tyrobutyricum]|uniref:ImmA/IrrE family metallo-endopeptidase n=1 Tax=Clostridium tyrobutyricum TaxID=1519 RepID=UPI00189F72E8|nr:ImmA/IrrE family metallo-endopeptidase [Clostridium tyrobutyricum]